MNSIRRVIIIISILGISALACQSAGDFFTGPTFVPTFVQNVTQAVPTIQVDPPQNATQDNLTPYIDDFSNIDSGWVRILTNDGGSDYTDGGYRIFIQKQNHTLWATSGNQYPDVRVQVTARLRDGETDNSYGIICRYQDENNFYTLVVSSDGYYAIRKRVDGNALETITGDRFEFSNYILLGERENALMAECEGNQLRLYANGEKIAEATDDDISSGDVGLIVSTFSAASTDILFDNFSSVEIP